MRFGFSHVIDSFISIILMTQTSSLKGTVISDQVLRCSYGLAAFQYCDLVNYWTLRPFTPDYVMERA